MQKKITVESAKRLAKLMDDFIHEFFNEETIQNEYKNGIKNKLILAFRVFRMYLPNAYANDNVEMAMPFFMILINLMSGTYIRTMDNMVDEYFNNKEERKDNDNT